VRRADHDIKDFMIPAGTIASSNHLNPADLHERIVDLDAKTIRFKAAESETNT
jgi:hypothetical protein